MDDHTDINVRKTLENCQEKQIPFTPWDAAEVEALEGLPFPNLSDVPALPEGYELYGKPLSVDLGDPEAIGKFKAGVVADIGIFSTSTRDVGYAIIAREENLATIQAYVQ